MLPHPLDLTVLIIYFALMLGLGFWFSRTNNSTEEYFLGGRRFAGWVIGISLVGTSISSITFLAYPGDAFKTNWLRFLPNLMLPVAIIIAIRYFLPRLRREGTVTAYEYLESRYGPSIRGYGAVAFIVAQITRVSMILYLISLVIQTITGLDAQVSVMIAGTLVVIYTLLGGIEAVIWTDVIQTIVLITGGLFCIVLIINQIPGGLATIIETAWQADKLSVGDFRADGYQPASWQISLTEKTAFMMLMVGLINWLTEYSSNQNTVQRFCASRSEREARKAMLICALVSVPTWAFFMFLGTALWVFFQHFPAEVAANILEGGSKAEEILPYFITHYLPKGLVGLLVAAAIAAAMSSLDSSINAIATVTTHDLYRRFATPDRDDRHYLKFARWVTALAGGAMVLGALYLIEASTTTLQDLATLLTALFAGGLLTIYLMGFFSNRCQSLHIGLGIFATLWFTLWTIHSPPGFVNYPFDLYYTGLLGNIVMFATAWGSSFLIRIPSDQNGN